VKGGPGARGLQGRTPQVKEHLSDDFFAFRLLPPYFPDDFRPSSIVPKSISRPYQKLRVVMVLGQLPSSFPKRVDVLIPSEA